MPQASKVVLVFLALGCLGGTWIASPGKGSHASGGATIGTQTASDGFAYSNGTVLNAASTSSTWDNFGSGDAAFQMVTGLASVSNLGGDGYAMKLGSWGNDQFSAAQVTISGSGTDVGFGVSVRGPTASGGAATFYRCVIGSDGTIALAKMVTGTFTAITTRSVTYSAGTELGLSIQGTTLKIWYGGTQQGASVTDSSISTGNPGLVYSSTASSGGVDNWRGGTVP